jgi:hypothetical protein
MGFNFGIAFTMRKKTRNEVEIEIEKERIAKLLASMFKLIQEVMDSLFRGMSVHFDFESNVADYPQTALRLNAPVILNDSGQFDLDKNWEESVMVQTRTQLSSLAKLCQESEKEAMLELNT